MSQKNTATVGTPVFQQQDLFGMVAAAVRAAGLTPKNPPIAARAFRPKTLRAADTRRKNAIAKAQIALDLATPQELRDRAVRAAGRRCLKCRRDFSPQHRHEFVCVPCKGLTTWKDGPVEYALAGF